jgi:hypothetical protein
MAMPRRPRRFGPRLLVAGIRLAAILQRRSRPGLLERDGELVRLELLPFANFPARRSSLVPEVNRCSSSFTDGQSPHAMPPILDDHHGSLCHVLCGLSQHGLEPLDCKVGPRVAQSKHDHAAAFFSRSPRRSRRSRDRRSARCVLRGAPSGRFRRWVTFAALHHGDGLRHGRTTAAIPRPAARHPCRPESACCLGQLVRTSSCVNHAAYSMAC